MQVFKLWEIVKHTKEQFLDLYFMFIYSTNQTSESKHFYSLVQSSSLLRFTRFDRIEYLFPIVIKITFRIFRSSDGNYKQSVLKVSILSKSFMASTLQINLPQASKFLSQYNPPQSNQAI
ncbi:unnamed protein product [Paramecium octaurelia]|uniref:Uncharacterized protein n=1 Tax=Paramecium octaurelia TaxID=43137 RepID=A0A8S1VYA3_PAROT|nr:unnamed protein product [Paramecium octaurelia]